MAHDQIAGLGIEGSPGWGYGLGFSVLGDATAAGVSKSPAFGAGAEPMAIAGSWIP